MTGSDATCSRLEQAIHDSERSLDKIGEGDWTPQDTAHQNLLIQIKWALASIGLRTGRIVHGDNDS